MPIELRADLIARERAAWAEIQVGALTVATARAVHAAVTAHAAASGETRIAVEEAVKRAVRHPEAGA